MEILYATDGSEGAQAGARLLNRLPLSGESEIHLLTVAERAGETAATEAALDRTEEALRGSPARLSRHTRRGNAAEQILEAAREQTPDLIVVGTRGLSAIRRFFVGSVAERVARHAPCPVLLVRPQFQELQQVVLGVDGSEHSDQAAHWLTRFPLPPGCHIRLTTIVTPIEVVYASRMTLMAPAAVERLVALTREEQEEARTRLDALTASFAAAGKQVVPEVRTGAPVPGLLSMADEMKADLIVVGSQGLSGIDRFLMGSVSEQVLRYAPCSVLVVR